jgi:O-antigen/teichoic acid export membrane protein
MANISGFQYRNALERLRSSPAVRGTAHAFFIQIVGKALTFLSTWVMARLLNVESFGIFAYARNWTLLLAPFATLGLPVIALQILPAAHVHNRPGEGYGFVRFSILMTVLGGSLMAAGLFAAAHYGVVPLPQGYANAFMWALLALPAYGLISVFAMLGQSTGRIDAAFYPSLVLQPALFLLFLIATLALAPAALSGETAMGFFALASLFSAVVAVIWVVRTLPASWRAAKPLYDGWNWLRLSIAPALSFFGMTVVARYPQLVLANHVSKEEFSRFVLAAILAQLIAMARDAVNGSIISRLSQQISAGDLRQARRLLGVGFILMVAPTLAFVAVCYAFGDVLLGTAGERFRAGHGLLVLLALDQLVWAGGSMFASVLTLHGRYWLSTGILSGSTLVVVVLCAVLVPIYGGYGAAYAGLGASCFWLLASILAAVLMTSLFRKR